MPAPRPGATDIRITGNRITGHRRVSNKGGVGIYAKGPAGNVQILANRIADNRGHGVTLQGGTPM